MKINLGAIAMHAILAGIATTTAGMLFGIAVAVVAAVLLSIGYPLREVATAATRNKVEWDQAARIVWNGEPGWSEWNLRGQAFAPVVAAWLCVLYVASVS